MTLSLRTIREARPNDLPRIMSIRLGVTENTLSDPSLVTDDEVGWYIREAIFLVAENDGEVVAFTCVDQRTGYVWALFVDEEHEGRGAGSALLAALVDRLRVVGIVQAHLTTGRKTKAFAWYLARGFRHTGMSFKGEAVLVRAL